MASWLPRRPRLRSLEPWQRNQYAVVLAVGIAFAAFELTQPFVPLYILELGAADLAEAAFWAGLISGAAPLCSAITGPFWGAMADRFGRKPMLLRALLFIGILTCASAFAPNVYWLLALRVLMGLTAGFTPMAMALAVGVSPRERMGQAIGMIQAAQLAPMAIGPPIGGLLSDIVGLRASFFITGLLLIVPGLLVWFLVTETFDRSAAERTGVKGRRAVSSALGLFAIPGFAVAVGILMVIRFTDRAVPPMLPLYLVQLETPPGQLATITGLVVAAGAVTATCSAVVYGRWATPATTRRLLLLALGGGALFSALLAFTRGWGEVVVVRALLGLLAGGTMSLAFTFGARLVPTAQSSLALAVLTSAGMIGAASAPIMAGMIAQSSLRVVFLASAGAFLVGLLLAALPVRARRRVAVVEPAPDQPAGA